MYDDVEDLHGKSSRTVAQSHSKSTNSSSSSSSSNASSTIRQEYESGERDPEVTRAEDFLSQQRDDEAESGMDDVGDGAGGEDTGAQHDSESGKKEKTQGPVVVELSCFEWWVSAEQLTRVLEPFNPVAGSLFMFTERVSGKSKGTLEAFERRAC